MLFCCSCLGKRPTLSLNQSAVGGDPGLGGGSWRCGQGLPHLGNRWLTDCSSGPADLQMVSPAQLEKEELAAFQGS